MKIQIQRKKFDADICSGLGNWKGFMFSFSQYRAKVLSFSSERKIALHMLFVFFPLHVLFLDSRMKVVDYALLRPFTFYSSGMRAKYAVEVPFSLWKGLRVRKGEKIKFIR